MTNLISKLFITILYMFRAIPCSSSGGQVVLIQHLVSSLSVSDRLVHRLRKNMFRAISCSSSGGQIVLIQHLVSSLSVSDRQVRRCTVRSLTESDVTRCCINRLQMKCRLLYLKTQSVPCSKHVSSRL